MSIKEKCGLTEEEYITFESIKNSTKNSWYYDIMQPYFYNGVAIVMVLFTRSEHTSSLFYFGILILVFNVITTGIQQIKYRRIFASMLQKLSKAIASEESG